jgi:hypothetical protein
VEQDMQADLSKDVLQKMSGTWQDNRNDEDE